MKSFHGRAPDKVDIQALLNTMLERWDEVFASELKRVVRSYVHELRDVRNRWARESEFSASEARRAVDTVALLGEAIGVRLADPKPEDAIQRDSHDQAVNTSLTATLRGRQATQREVTRAAPRSTSGTSANAVEKYWTMMLCSPNGRDTLRRVV
ncbi:MAG: Swt1 family HEPN domain-containing protein [Gemmatimonadaceae bacterium]